MITVNMTELEYQAYLLYLKSIEIMRKAEKSVPGQTSLEKYLSDYENSIEMKAGLEDIKSGRITYVDPENLWESIK